MHIDEDRSPKVSLFVVDEWSGQKALVASWHKQAISLNGSSALPAQRTAKSWVVGHPSFTGLGKSCPSTTRWASWQ
jgi:hypothetical protein